MQGLPYFTPAEAPLRGIAAKLPGSSISGSLTKAATEGHLLSAAGSTPGTSHPSRHTDRTIRLSGHRPLPCRSPGHQRPPAAGVAPGGYRGRRGSLGGGGGGGQAPPAAQGVPPLKLDRAGTTNVSRRRAASTGQHRPPASGQRSSQHHYLVQ